MGFAVSSAVLHAPSYRAGAVCCLLSTCILLPARADEAEAAEAPLNERALASAVLRPSIQAALTVDVSPAAVPPASRLSNRQLDAASAEVVDYRAWLGSDRASLGVGFTAAAYRDARPGLAGNGLEQAHGLNAGPLLAASGGPMLGLGLRYRLSRDSQLTFDSLASGRSDDITPQMRVGMEFKSPPSQVLGIARGTFMRAQLSSSSQLSLNWRGGKVALMLRSQF